MAKSTLQLRGSSISSSNFHLNDDKIRFGSNATASIVMVTGSLTVSGSNSFTNYGQFTNYLVNQPANYGQQKFIVQSNYLNDLLGPLTDSVNQVPYVQFVVSASGHVGVGTQEPAHTLHVSQSSASWNALQVDGPSEFNGFAGSIVQANKQVITSDVSVPAGYTGVLWVSNYNPNITINAGVNFTVNAGSDIGVYNMGWPYNQ
jgi:hypothetical protein